MRSIPVVLHARFENFRTKGTAFGIRLLELVFHPDQSKQHKVLQNVWLAGLFLLGVVLWVFFLNTGDIDFDFLDWAEVNGPRLAIWQSAIRQGDLPLHTNNMSGLRGVTDRFLAIADTPFSPQFFALKFLSLGQFVVFNTLLLYAAGFAGLVFLAKRFRLSLFVMIILFWLFNFNGHILSHIAVGHTNYAGHLLLPFFVLLVLQVAGGGWNWRWVLSMALLMLGILLQGDFHLYVWCLLFLSILALAYPRLMPGILAAGASVLLLSMVRILPPVVELGKMDSEFKNGFASITDILAALGVLVGPEAAYQRLSILDMTAIWEKTTYIGVLGLIFLGLFGIYYPLKSLSRQNGFSGGYVRLLFPSLILTILSYGTLYRYFTLLAPIPILAGERVSSRFLILPVLVIAGVGALYLQRIFDQGKQTILAKAAYLSLLFWMGVDLLQNLKLWRLEEIASKVDLFPKVAFDPAAHAAASRADPLYNTLILVGGLVSLVTLLVLGVLAWREGQKNPHRDPDRGQ